MAHVLLVDDEKVSRTIYSDFLTGAGHTVVSVGLGSDAKVELSKMRFDVVVTDLILPQLDGIDLLQYVKTHHPGIEVLVITALDKVDPAVRAIKSGASDYLVKPVNPEVLAHAINRAMATRSLLTENGKLRQHVALLETGQRIVTTLDRRKLGPMATEAFHQTTGADAAVLVVARDRGFVIEGGSGPDDSTCPWLTTDSLQSMMKQVPLNEPSHWITGDSVPAPYRKVFVSKAQDDNNTLGAMLLFFTKPPHSDVAVNAGYLSRYLALALKNLGRFAEVEDLIYLDDLTHLFNSRYLGLVLDREMKICAENASSFSLLFLDLDYFKNVNDSHGHLVGSKLLVEMGRIIKSSVRDFDVVCRWGGDEYVLLLKATDSGGALKVAERIRRTVESHKFLAREGYTLNLTTCIGVASFPEHATDSTTLLDFADRAMYRGKKGSRNVIYMASKDLEATPVERKSASGEATDVIKPHG